METFGIGLLASTVVAVLYGLFIAQREERIRAYLKQAPRGVLRRLYVRALIQAVRGEAGVADSRHLAVLLVLVMVVAAAGNKSRMDALERDVTQVQEEIRTMSEDAVNPPDLAELEQRAEQLLQDMIKRAESMQADMPAMILIGRGITASLFVLAAAGWYAWMPYVLLRRRFDHEIARFSLRIQGLATQEELADLIASELAVSDQATLQAYVAAMKQVAKRHGMPQLTRTFELWESDAHVA